MANGLFGGIGEQIRQADMRRERATVNKFMAPGEATEIAQQTYQDAIEAAQEAARNGATAEQLKPLRELAGGAATEFARVHNARLKAARDRDLNVEGIPEVGQQHIDMKLAEFDAMVQAASAGQQQGQVQTLAPEEAQELGFPEGSVVQQDPDGQLNLLFNPAQGQSSLMERVQALKASGIEDEQLALGIAAGRYQVSLDPTTRERVTMDIATGEPVGQPDTPQPAGGEHVPMIPEDVDTSEATGFEGMISNAANIMTDAFGMGVMFPRAQEATDALKTTQTLTTTTLQEEVPGRPSNMLMERLEGLTVSPNSLLQGEDRARSRIVQTKGIIDSEIDRIENEVLPRDLPPDVRNRTELNLLQLRRLSESYGTLAQGFEEAETDPELEALLEKWAPQNQGGSRNDAENENGGSGTADGSAQSR